MTREARMTPISAPMIAWTHDLACLRSALHINTTRDSCSWQHSLILKNKRRQNQNCMRLIVISWRSSLVFCSLWLGENLTVWLSTKKSDWCQQSTQGCHFSVGVSRGGHAYCTCTVQPKVILPVCACARRSLRRKIHSVWYFFLTADWFILNTASSFISPIRYQCKAVNLLFSKRSQVSI